MTFKVFSFKAHIFALLCILLGICEYRRRIFVSFLICSVHTVLPYHWLLAVHVYHIKGLKYESINRECNCWSLYLDCKQPRFEQMDNAKCKSFDFLNTSKYYNNLSPEKAKEVFLYTFRCPLPFKKTAIAVTYTDNLD